MRVMASAPSARPHKESARNRSANIRHHLLCFHSLTHSLTNAEPSPLCFHNLTNCFSGKSFVRKTLQKHRGGGTPVAKNRHFVHDQRVSVSKSGRLPRVFS